MAMLGEAWRGRVRRGVAWVTLLLSTNRAGLGTGRRGRAQRVLVWQGEEY